MTAQELVLKFDLKDYPKELDNKDQSFINDVDYLMQRRYSIDTALRIVSICRNIKYSMSPHDILIFMLTFNPHLAE